MAAKNEILKDTLNLKPAEKAELVDKLLSSLDNPEMSLTNYGQRRRKDVKLLQGIDFPA